MPPVEALTLPEMRVDADWYVARNAVARQSLLRSSKLDLDEQFRNDGQLDGADPNPIFWLSQYLTESGYERRASGMPPCEDYIRNAGRLKASANWLFDEGRFLRLYPAVADSVQKGNWISGYLYYLRIGRKKDLSPHALFNPAYYRFVADLKPEEDAFEHFMRIGQFKGLSPTPLFDAEFYLNANNVVDEIGPGKAFVSPLHHFAAKGMRLGFSPLPDFDAEYYLACSPDVKAAIDTGQLGSAFEHFLNSGIKEGRRPNEFFSAEDYCWYNPGISAEMKAYGFVSGFEHFLAFGVKKRLRGHRPAFSVPVPEIHSKGIFEQRARIAAQLFSHETLEFPAAAQPLTSFILPVHDNFAFTLSLLGQLEREARATPDNPIEVIVVDNGSTDRTAQLEHFVRGVRVIRTEKALGYTLACNLGAQDAKGEILVFLNNDIELTPGILKRIPRSFVDPTVAIAGARIVNTAGRLQEAGSILWADGSAAGLGRGDDPTLPIYLAPRDVDFVSGCFLCVRRELFGELGGFDPRFSPGYYEDTDLCLQARQLGRRVVYDPSLVIIHYEYASYSKGRPPSSSRSLMQKNQRAFVRKNLRALKDQPRQTDVSVMSGAFSKVREGASQRILMIEDRIPAAVAGSGFGRAEDILHALTAAGALVSVWSLHQRAELDFPDWTNGAWTLLPKIGGPTDIRDYIQRHGDEFDIIWVCRTHNFRNLRPTLSAWRNSRSGRRIVVDTEAVASLRDASLQELCGKIVSPTELTKAVQAELSDLSAVDKVISVNGIDARAIHDAHGFNADVLGFSFAPRPSPADFAEREGIAFLGALYGTDTPNYDSLVWFIEEILPLIDKKIPGIQFHVAGYVDRHLPAIKTKLGDQINWLGEINDLDAFFGAARVFVAPTRFAGGVPHKVANAAAHGLPAVVTPLLARQLNDDSGENYFLSPADISAAAFADCVIRLYQEPDLWADFRAKGLQHANKFYSPEDFVTKVRDLIGA